MFRNVIAGIDGHDGGRDAAALATALGGGRLTLVSAYPADPFPTRASVGGYEMLLREDTERILEATRLELGIEAELVAVPDLSPARALHRVAEERDAGLIVVGSSHHGPLGRILLGDVGRVVLHGAPCPVAVAPKRFHDGPPRTVGVGFDGSDEARAALHVAATLASDHDASLILYVVWETPPMPVAVAAGDAIELDHLLADSRSRAERLLADALTGLPGRVSGHTLHGRPALHLEEAARRLDLLVVGSRGWGPARRVALGSTSDWLVHRAACPVLVVPRPQPAAAQDAGAVASTADITA